ncbi:RidA family protein [Nocardia yunnanensis]|uniref:RidA family protein n=1 Tax=Nocardia yunnanensis TaxID=2382165 RepID=A0A386ZMG1_9NOCA|nr:RidA family protein [Nocardia yunnanensis]AYF78400.1 RidA family protein [Nocardia yunnanensis]
MSAFPLARSASGLVFTSGLAAVDPDTLTVTTADFEGQATEVFRQLDTALAAAGSGRDRILRLECYLAERRWFPAWNTVFRTYFPTAAPARITTVTTLPIDGLLIEIQAIAVATAQEDRS